MGVSLKKALLNFDEAIKRLYASDPRVHAVGITRHGSGYGYRAIRNVRKIVAMAAHSAQPSNVENIPVVYNDAPNDPQSLLKKIIHSGPASALEATLIPEQQLSRPLVCGLQIQNFDDDIRQGTPQQGFIVIGTLGCFVRLNGDGAHSYILSNNHVVAGQNRGLNEQDHIFQQGSAVFDTGQFTATLRNFVQLQFSPFGATVEHGTAILNDVDAGIARVEAGIANSNTYLPVRSSAPVPIGTAQPKNQDRVIKVGRTTGFTRGKIISFPAIVGPVDYDGKPAWFRNSIIIEGDGGASFSDRGDSGSIIIKEATGEIIGLLYAGNGQQSYACPINLVLSALNCSI